MPPRPFYEVKPDLYLFGRNEGPEERVRQWILFELLSTYGELVSNLDIERPVRVGTRTHYADIVVLKNHVPFIVIECKRQEDKKIDNCISQAISYASADEIRAEFAVCTNGHTWLVRRKVGSEWVAVPDIPTSRDIYLGIELDSLLGFVQSLRPLLYWLHQEVPADRAQEYLENLQRFFICNGCFRYSVHKNLWDGTEFLSRTLVHNPITSNSHTMGNLRAAFKTYTEYLQSIGYRPFAELLSCYNIRELLSFLLNDFGKLAQDSSGIDHREVFFLRFIASFLRYMLEVHDEGCYLSIPARLVSDFNTLVDVISNTRLKVRFPDSLEDKSDLVALCSYEWKSIEP